MPLLEPLSLGLRCWEQWRGWGFCQASGDLIDPAGQRHSAGTVQGAAWILALATTERSRLIFADSGTVRPVLATDDLRVPGPQAPSVAPATGPRSQPSGRSSGDGV